MVAFRITHTLHLVETSDRASHVTRVNEWFLAFLWERELTFTKFVSLRSVQFFRHRRSFIRVQLLAIQ